MAEDGYKVSLNVYDLSQGLARQLSTTFLGKAIEAIWHTGVVVYGTEYYFGGGIQKDPAGMTPYGTPIRVVDLGVTHLSKEVFEQYLEEIRPRYTAETYNLLNHNCNNFSNEVAQFLVGATVPDYILQLPNEVMSSPMGALILPMIQRLEMTLRSNSVPQVPQFVPTAMPPTSRGPFATSSLSTPNTVSTREAQREMIAGSPKGSPANSTESRSSEKPSLSSVEGVSAKKIDSSESGCIGKTGASEGSADNVTLEARKKVQEEITREFTALMAAGNLRASEAAALATRKVMERYGILNASAVQQS